MSTDAQLQMALAQDEQFLNRVQYAMATYAVTVMGEGSIVNHALRAAYAKAVLADPAAAASAIAVGLVGAVNLTSANTFLHPNKEVTSDATDAAILAQVSSLWNAYSGVS